MFRFACILAFDVKVEKDAQIFADHEGVRIFQADIIYHLEDSFLKYRFGNIYFDLFVILERIFDFKRGKKMNTKLFSHANCESCRNAFSMLEIPSLLELS